MKLLLLKFWKDEEGATAIEYALIAGLIAVAIIGVLTLMGTELRTLFSNIAGELTKAGTEAGTPTTP